MIKRLTQFFTSRFFYHFFLTANLIVLAVLKIKYVYIERIWPDEALYAWLAQQISLNPLYIFSKELTLAPLFPIILSLGNAFFESEISYRWICLLINLLGVSVIYQLGRKISGDFLGVFSALALGSTYLYYSYGTNILIDMPNAVFHIIFALELLNIRTPLNQHSHWRIGLWGTILILLKLSNIIILVWLSVYYLWVFKKEGISTSFHKLSLPFLLIILTFSALLAKNYVMIGKPIPSLTALTGIYYGRSAGYYVQNFDLLIPAGLIPFFIVGLINSFRNINIEKRLFSSWFFIYFIIFSLVPEKDPRYLLPVVPCVVIITGMGVETFLHWLTKNNTPIFIYMQLFILTLVSLIAMGEWKIVERFLFKNTQQYTGFKEAGNLIKSYAKPETVVLVSSPQAMRYFTNINYQDAGGTISPLPKNKQTFELLLQTTKQAVILEIDRWEFTQPKWIYPLTSENLQYLYEHDFEIIGEIHKNYRPPMSSERGGKFLNVLLLYRPSKN